MRRLPKHTTAAILTALYLVIALTPLSPILLKSAHIAHAITGECSGECKVDGCSLESRANHTCCCWQKKLKRTSLKKQVAKASCCTSGIQPAETAESCCAPPRPIVAVSCCTPPAKEHDSRQPLANQITNTSEPAEDRAAQTVFKCGSPCGSGKLLSLLKLSTDECIPYRFVEKLPQFSTLKFAAQSAPTLTSITIEPPEHPPRLPIIF